MRDVKNKINAELEEVPDWFETYNRQLLEKLEREQYKGWMSETSDREDQILDEFPHIT